uniref:Uncharacterized protein n=1 Tax=Onchocerca volvulus TaxID=6282 RepID=A0A8R1TKP4_ONCVO
MQSLNMSKYCNVKNLLHKQILASIGQFQFFISSFQLSPFLRSLSLKTVQYYTQTGGDDNDSGRWEKKKKKKKKNLTDE